MGERPRGSVEIPELTEVRDVKVRNVEVVLPNGHAILAPTSFDVGARASLAVVGPSGSGKSTLLDCLTGWRAPSAGLVRIGRVRISDLEEGHRSAFRRDRIGVVFQEPFLMEELSVAENVTLVKRFRGESPEALASQADAVLRQVGLDGYGGRRVGALSGGEAQRVSVARALLSATALVVADEPTAALDAHNASVVAGLLVEGARVRGVPVVLATHDPAVAAKCDTVLDLRRAG